MIGALATNDDVSLRPLNFLLDECYANIESGICGRRYQDNCLEFVFFRQSRNSLDEEEGHHCSCEGSHISRTRRYDR